ncbi:CDP-glycerol glycerophosphotransferase family protein [Enterobacter ludwigii]
MLYLKEFLFLLINSLLTVITSFAKLDDKRIIVTSTHNSSYNFNSKYFYEFATSESLWKDYSIYYVINDVSKRNELNDHFRTKRFISSNTLKEKLFCLSAKCWISSTFELPVNSFIINKKRIVVHLGHGVPLKKIGLNEERITLFKRINRIIRTRQFTDIVCYSEILKDSMMKTFANEKANYVCLGQPRNDSLRMDVCEIKNRLAEISGANSDAKFILYAPTWRPYATTVFFPFDIDIEQLNSFLKYNNIYIFFRSHPFYPSVIDENISKLDNIVQFNSIIAPEICDYLCAFDSLITDYSSIYIDYLTTNKPIGFIPYDLDSYIKHVGFCYDYDEFTPGMKIYNCEGLIEFLVENGSNFENKREVIRKITNTKSTGNCLELSKYLHERLLSQ